MAISFSTGTINQPDAGSVGLAMIEKLRDDLVAHAAWDLVEEFTPASGQVRWYVFKCLASVSGMASDWHLVIGRTLGSGEFRGFICEEYTVAGHIANYWSIGQNYTNTYSFESLGRYNQNYTLGITPVGTSGIYPTYSTWTPSGTSTKYWIIVADDGFTVAFNGASNGFWHCGAYVPLTQLPVTLPVCMMGYSDQTGGQVGQIIRNPAVANVTNVYGGALGFSGGGDNSPPTSNLLGFASYMQYNDKLQANQRPVAEIGMVTMQYQPHIGVPAFGYVLGKHKRMRTGSSGNTPPGFAFGDAYVLNNRLWVPWKPTDARIWDTGVAAS